MFRSFAGHLLVASPHLRDPNFLQAVVLLVQHNSEGAFGITLNRPIDKTVQDLWNEVEATSPCPNTHHLNMGGPVSGPVMALHTRESLGEVEILPGVYFSAEREHLERLVQELDLRLKVFIGHSGWGGGQLESELEQGAWFTTPASADHVFHDEYRLWKTVCGQIGDSLLSETLRIKGVPENPELN